MKKKKKAITLLEIMIVIFLIGLIGSAIGYSMKGSLDEGRAFRTEQAINQVKDILTLEMAREGLTAVEVTQSTATIIEHLKHSGLVKDPHKLIKDGWGIPLSIEADHYGNDILISSNKYTNYLEKKRRSSQNNANAGAPTQQNSSSTIGNNAPAQN